jgi:very-short-patch-repair endonuclease
LGGLYCFMTKRKKGNSEKEKFLRELGAQYAKDLTIRCTPYENAFMERLVKTGVEFYFQYPVVCEQCYLYILDFYLPEYSVVFEIDGNRHYTKSGKKYDSTRTRRLKKLGLRVFRISNSLVAQLTPNNIKQLLKDAV